MKFSTLLLSATSALATSVACSTPPSTPSPPPAPELTFLYTLYVDCLRPLYTFTGPLGNRTAIPIIGGNFTGPRLSGTVLDLGADWGLTDTFSGVFQADTRYQLRTDDGTDIFIRTSGPDNDRGGLDLRIVFEVGRGAYYWLNQVVAIGQTQNVGSIPGGFTLRIDAWHIASNRANQTTTEEPSIAAMLKQ